MDWMYANCSATAQRGALDWKPKFKKAVTPLFRELYRRVKSGAETRRPAATCRSTARRTPHSIAIALRGELPAN